MIENLYRFGNVSEIIKGKRLDNIRARMIKLAQE